MTATVPSRQDAPRHGHDLSALIGSAPGRNQRPTSLGCLHDHHGRGQPADNPIPARKMEAQWWRRGAQFAHQSALRGYLPGQGGMLPGIDDVDPAPEDGGGARCPPEASSVRRTINSADQAAYYSDAAIGQFGSQTLGDLARIGRTRARLHRATQSESSRPGRPTTQRTGGGSSIAARRPG